MHADLNYDSEEQPNYSSSNDESLKKYSRANSPKAKSASRKAKRSSPVPGGGMARRRNKHWQW